MKKFGILFCVLITALFAFSAPVKASKKYEVLKNKPIDTSRKPAEGKALIYFCRTQVVGSAIKVKLYVDGEFLSIMGPRTYVAYECDPGKHEFITTTENAGFLEANVEAGKIYVVQVCMHMGGWKARTHFETARTGSEALKEISKTAHKLYAVKTTEAGMEWVKEDDSKIRKKIKKYRDKGKEFENLNPEDGYDKLPWVK